MQKTIIFKKEQIKNYSDYLKSSISEIHSVLKNNPDHENKISLEKRIIIFNEIITFFEALIFEESFEKDEIKLTGF